jgi:hypothetical protein
MDPNEDKYVRVIGFLKRSRPEPGHPEVLNEKIMSELRKQPARRGLVSLLSDFFFGWAYIGWVRNSLVFFSALILVIFFWQQSVIVRRIRDISRQEVYAPNPEFKAVSGSIDAKLLLQKAGYTLPVLKKELTKKELDELIESIGELQTKYRDLLQLIEADPELKKYVETKLNSK